jgi:hypothetical protein
MNRPLSSQQVHRRRLVLGLEQLEDRCVPACTITQTGVAPDIALTITGDNLVNNIQITDDGAGNISLTCDGVVSPVVAGVKDIIVDSKAGKDTVFYTLTGDLQAAQTRNLKLDLGDGNDNFLAQNINNADVMGTAALSINVKGNLGNDKIRFRFTQDFDVNATGLLKINAAGSAGDDRIALVQLGQISGACNIALRGGSGRDGVGASLNLDSNSAGTVNATVSGNADDDLLTLLLTAGDAFTGTLTGAAKGGAGVNAAVVSDFVAVTAVPAGNILRMP